MKIVYIPIVLPVNIRSLVAMVLVLVGLVLTIAGVAYGRWLTVEYRNGRSTFEDGEIMSVTILQGLQDISTRSCYFDATYRTAPMCGLTEVEYAQCDTSEKSLWCSGRYFFLASFGLLVLTIIGAGIGELAGLYREFILGPVVGCSSVFGVIALVLFRLGVSQVSSQGPTYILRYFSSQDNGSVDINMSASFPLCAVGVACLLLAGIISSSLLCYRAESSNPVAHDPPRVQVVEMRVGATTSVARAAPRPGFVALSRNEFQIANDESDDDLGLIHENTPAPARPPVAFTDS